MRIGFGQDCVYLFTSTGLQKPFQRDNIKLFSISKVQSKETYQVNTDLFDEEG